MSLSQEESHLSQDLVPKPSLTLPISFYPLYSSLSGEPILISNRESERVQKRIRGMNSSLGGMSPPSVQHTGVKLPTSYDDVWGKIPTFGHNVLKKPTNRYRSMYQPMDIMLGRGMFMGIILRIVYS